MSLTVIANEQAERRRLACEAASLMPREVLQQANKQTLKIRTLFSATLLYLYELQLAVSRSR